MGSNVIPVDFRHSINLYRDGSNIKLYILFFLVLLIPAPLEIERCNRFQCLMKFTPWNFGIVMGSAEASTHRQESKLGGFTWCGTSPRLLLDLYVISTLINTFIHRSK